MIFGRSLKNPTLRGEFHKKPIWRGRLPKYGGELGQFVDLRGRRAWQERVRGGGGGVFEGGLIPRCALC